MGKVSFFIVLFIFWNGLLFSQIAINTDGSPPANSAMLDVQSTDRGLLIPRISTSSRDIIPSPATGLLIFNTTTYRVEYYNGSYWHQLETTFISTTYGTLSVGGGVSINVSPDVQPENSAMLDVNNPTRGILIPRTTPDLITSPSTGLMIYNTSTNQLNYYNGNQWMVLCSISAGITGATGSQASVGLAIKTDNSSPHHSAMLDVSATDKGVLIPRLTNEERDAILPFTGLIIYNTSANNIEFYNGSAWYRLITNLLTSPTPGIHIPSPDQIVWNWNPVPDAMGYKWSITNNYDGATDMGTVITKTEPGLTCNTAYTRYIWAYNSCGNSTSVILTQTTSLNPPSGPGVKCVDDDNSSIQNGSSQYPYVSIQMAVTNAVDYDTIKVAAGTYDQIDNMGKCLTILGGFQGGTSTFYDIGCGGNFLTRTADPTLTIISGGVNSIGVNLTRYNDNPFMLVFDNFTVKNCRKGIVCDIAVSWPHVERVTISNNIIENNGQPFISTTGAGILICGVKNKILNNIIRNNHGGRGAGIAANGSSPDSLIVEGNLIENNTCYDDHCAGVYLDGDVTIRNNVISGNILQNSYGWGGGVLILGTAHMSFNVIKNNYSPSYGAGVFVDEGGIAYMDHELIYHNSSSLYGAGVAVDYGDPGSSYVYMTNCTVANNYSPGTIGGNAVFLDINSFCTLKNCIMAGNGDDFQIESGSSLTATYTLSEEGVAGQGNFTADPLFADTLNGDFHLKSKGGRYNPISQSWVIDSIHSPAIDAGDPASPYNNEPVPNGNRINLGCYGNTIYASKSFFYYK